ncbi:MAG: DNA repair protein RecO [Verrucomicrobiae bacterium]|nr:DNA repair protein RecO [Verrucomicrobiae bacterium]
MLESATGLILRTWPLTETSLIVEWLTAESGRMSTSAKGARRPRSPFLGKLDVFYEADFTFSRSRRSELHTLRELRLGATHDALRRNLDRLEAAAYCAKLIEQTTETDTPVPRIYELMRDVVRHLDTHPAGPQIIFAFELKLLRELGQQPDPARTSLDARTRELLVRLLESDWSDLANISLTARQINDLRLFLHGYLIYHLGRIPKGRPIHAPDPGPD